MATPIPQHRLDALARMTLCQPSRDWLAVPGRTYEDLGSIPEGPHWAYLAARYPGANVELLQAVVIAHGDAETRRKFAANVPGADRAALLAGL
ncbi:MAG: hypothetical protein L3J73_02765 [Thermoplasmata archaeon]|nr:hypothetical protein [Thermoplasmata archaeon]